VAGFCAGAAVTDITPPLGTYLAGYYHARQAVDVHDPLTARALCLADGGGEIAIVACDLIGLSRESVAAIKQRVQALCGLGPERVLVGCTHTHTGPEIRAQALFPTDDHYLDLVEQRIADAVVIARRRLAPAQLAEPIKKAVRGATKYPEGRGVHLNAPAAGDIPGIVSLVGFKLGAGNSLRTRS